MTLKRSPGAGGRAPYSERRLGLRIDVPAIDPDVSMMYVTSRGVRGAAHADGRWACSISSAYVLPSFGSVNTAARRCAADVRRPRELEVAIGRHRPVAASTA